MKFVYNYGMNIQCPICKKNLVYNDHSVVCENHHSFDLAKSGYLNLYRSNKKDHGDNKEMVKARTAFLESDAYRFLKDRLVSVIGEPDTFVDLACGEGYYTKDIRAKEKYGIDLSKDALIHASKQDKSTSYLLASIFDLPFEQESADVVLTCFAPFAKEEIERVLKPGGRFVFVTPGEDHLFEMKEVLYENPYHNVIKELDTSMQLIHQECITEKSVLSTPQLLSLFQMTPYAYKTGIGGLEKLQQKTSLEMTKQFIIRIYQK